eukprot:412392-Rhodomonas_salina.1
MLVAFVSQHCIAICLGGSNQNCTEKSRNCTGRHEQEHPFDPRPPRDHHAYNNVLVAHVPRVMLRGAANCTAFALSVLCRWLWVYFVLVRRSSRNIRDSWYGTSMQGRVSIPPASNSSRHDQPWRACVRRWR